MVVMDEIGRAILNYLQNQREEMISFLVALAQAESPSSEPEAQVGVMALLWEMLQSLGYRVEMIPGQKTGGHLLARPNGIAGGQVDLGDGPQQLLLGHCDTVWPMGTLRQMPVVVEENVVRGPGVYDMKGGLVQMLYALQAVQQLGLCVEVRPLVFINSDEEIGSIESMPHIEQLAQEVNRTFVLEPSLGEKGKLKTARKGVGRFHITVHGKAAHAGLDPEKGVSAVLELSYVVQQLFALNDRERGVSVNVGIVEGGVRSNVIAPLCTALVDVRVPTVVEAQRLEAIIRGLKATVAGARVAVNGRIGRAPLERTPANRALWQLAQEAGQWLNIPLTEGMAGGGSDGNTTSLYTATLDGLGAVGDGAHAAHEFLYIDKMVERSALLALLLLAPPLDDF